MSTKHSPTIIKLSQIFAGIGIGLLMGLIIGLSASPVVKSILGTLSGLLGVFLGLQENIFGKGDSEEASNRTVLSSLRAGSFGIACTLAILFGLYLRANDKIGMTPSEQVQRWTDAGYEPNLARELAMYEKINMNSEQLLGLHKQPVTVTVASDGQDSGNAVIAVTTPSTGGLASTVLFSFEDLPNIASLLDPALYDNDAQKTIRNYHILDVPQIDALADAVEKHYPSPDEQLEILSDITFLCIMLSTREDDYNELHDAMQNMTDCRAWTANNDLPELDMLLENIEQTIPEDEQDQFLITIAAVLFEIDFE